MVYVHLSNRLKEHLEGGIGTVVKLRHFALCYDAGPFKEAKPELRNSLGLCSSLASSVGGTRAKSLAI